MKWTALAILTLLSSSSGAPSPSTPPQTAHFTFLDPFHHPLYNLSVVANGISHPTGDDAARVARIAAPDYNAAALCELDFALSPDARLPEHVFVVGEDGHTGQVRIEPPTPVRAIKCEGTCVQNYGTCNGADGRGPRLCCNGYCAANLCRPWDGVQMILS